MEKLEEPEPLVLSGWSSAELGTGRRSNVVLGNGGRGGQLVTSNFETPASQSLDDGWGQGRSQGHSDKNKNRLMDSVGNGKFCPGEP